MISTRQSLTTAQNTINLTRSGWNNFISNLISHSTDRDAARFAHHFLDSVPDLIKTKRSERGSVQTLLKIAKRLYPQHQKRLQTIMGYALSYNLYLRNEFILNELSEEINELFLSEEFKQDVYKKIIHRIKQVNDSHEHLIFNKSTTRNGSTRVLAGAMMVGSDSSLLSSGEWQSIERMSGAFDLYEKNKSLFEPIMFQLIELSSTREQAFYLFEHSIGYRKARNPVSLNYLASAFVLNDSTNKISKRLPFVIQSIDYVLENISLFCTEFLKVQKDVNNACSGGFSREANEIVTDQQYASINLYFKQGIRDEDDLLCAYRQSIWNLYGKQRTDRSLLKKNGNPFRQKENSEVISNRYYCEAFHFFILLLNQYRFSNTERFTALLSKREKSLLDVAVEAYHDNVAIIQSRSDLFSYPDAWLHFIKSKRENIDDTGAVPVWYITPFNTQKEMVSLSDDDHHEFVTAVALMNKLCGDTHVSRDFYIFEESLKIMTKHFFKNNILLRPA